MNHLKIINHTYYFRLCIPQDLKVIFGCCEIKRSLATSDYKRANIIALTLAHRLKDIITMARTKPSTLSSDQIRSLVDTHVKQVMESLEHRSLTRPPITIDQAKEEAIHISEMQGDYEEALATRSWHVVDHLVDNLLEGRAVDKLSRNKLSRELLGAVVKLHSVMESHSLGDYDVKIPAARSQVQPETTPEQTSISLGDLADAYEKDKQGSWRPSSANKWNGYRKVFFRFHDPATQTHTITRKVFYEYRELLRCLPKAFMTTKKYDGMTAEDVRTLKVPNPIDPKTVNGHIIFLHGMFKLAVNKLEDITTNPASDMQLTIKGDARKLRDMFTVVELETMFNSPAFINTKYPYRFWVTVLSLFSGARREELCSLYAEDIKQEDGVWYIDITADKPDKHIKTFQIRTVPIHPFVIELGFLEFVKTFQKGQRLWPELNNNNQDKKYGHYYGRWFNDNLLRPLDIKPTKAEKADGSALKDHHSFRHTIINIGIRAGLDIQKVKGLVGHKEGGVTFGTYFKGFTVKQIFDEIVSQIDHGVDLDHLKKHRFARPQQ